MIATILIPLMSTIVVRYGERASWPAPRRVSRRGSSAKLRRAERRRRGRGRPLSMALLRAGVRGGALRLAASDDFAMRGDGSGEHGHDAVVVAAAGERDIDQVVPGFEVNGAEE